MITVIAKGVRNIPGISYQWLNNEYIKYVGNVGQHLEEAIYSFIHYETIPVTELRKASDNKSKPDHIGLINLGWRGWEGTFPTSLIKECLDNSALNEKLIAYYNEAIETSVLRLPPLTTYFHKDPRPDKFNGTALTGIQPYMGNSIAELTGNVVFADYARGDTSGQPTRGVLAYTKVRTDCKVNNYGIIEIDYNFGKQSAYFVSLGSNHKQTSLYLGVYGSSNITSPNAGTVFEIIP